MRISEEKIDKEQLIEDLHFLSDQGNYKSIKYAIECIDKLDKIEQIVDKWNNDASHSFEDMCKINMIINEIQKVSEKGKR